MTDPAEMSPVKRYWAAPFWEWFDRQHPLVRLGVILGWLAIWCGTVGVVLWFMDARQLTIALLALLPAAMLWIVWQLYDLHRMKKRWKAQHQQFMTSYQALLDRERDEED